MVAQNKHHKATRRGERPRRHRQVGTSRVVPPPALPAVRPSEEEEVPKEDEEPRPEDLAKEEEALKTQEAEEAASHAEEPAGARSRERSSYDGDTAIKLY